MATVVPKPIASRSPPSLGRTLGPTTGSGAAGGAVLVGGWKSISLSRIIKPLLSGPDPVCYTAGYSSFASTGGDEAP